MENVPAATALVLVDLQNDFLPGGALGVPGGDAVIPPLNRCAAAFAAAGRPVFATRDWHPPDHCSFREQGGPWPPHCVAGSEGAAFAPGLALPATAMVIGKGSRPEADAYSGFDGTDLARRLRDNGCDDLVVGGLATDYCVRATALDGLREGFEVTVLTDAVAAVDVQPGDGDRALAEMAEAGCTLTSSEEFCTA
ncbi:MAG: nicotinamidase [Pseudomonadota bacterium]